MFDEILKRFDLKFEDLNSLEREYLSSWYNSLAKNELTLDRVREYLSGMRAAVENELSNFDNSKSQDFYLKARLKNYLLLEAFLTSPEKAKRALEQSIASFTSLKPKER